MIFFYQTFTEKYTIKKKYDILATTEKDKSFTDKKGGYVSCEN